MSDDLAFREKKRVHTFLGRGVVEFVGELVGGLRKVHQKGSAQKLTGAIPH